MKPKFYLISLFSLSLFIFSCKTASKMYEKGNYDQAVELAAKKLQKDPQDQKLLDIIQSAYRHAVDDHESRISNQAASNDELKWEKIYFEYISLQKMYSAIYKVPEVFNIIHPSDYSSYLVTYSEKAANTRYMRGMAFMQQENKQSYKQAFREFDFALQFKPGDVDALQKKEQAFEYAVTNVIILPLQQNGGYIYSSYNVGGNNLDDQLLRDLQYSSGNEFVRFYSAWDARSKHIRVDQELEMRFSTLEIGRSHDRRSRRSVSKEIVLKETVYKPDSIVREYARVTADITTTSREINSRAMLQIDLRDEDGRFIWSDNLPATHSWSTEFASFTGDERALSETDKLLVNRRKEFAPPESEIMHSLLVEISNNMSYSIKNYYNRF